MPLQSGDFLGRKDKLVRWGSAFLASQLLAHPQPALFGGGDLKKQGTLGQIGLGRNNKGCIQLR